MILDFHMETIVFPMSIHTWIDVAPLPSYGTTVVIDAHW